MEAVLTFRNTHGAVNGERVLLEGGLAVRVMPLPTCLGAGCGLCLRVDGTDLEQALQILAESKIEVQGLFWKERLGRRTEYRPI